jgi:hypothetical protein
MSGEYAFIDFDQFTNIALTNQIRIWGVPHNLLKPRERANAIVRILYSNETVL